jgi:uncharacterized membrane protein YebE (DUF533 family)
MGIGNFSKTSVRISTTNTNNSFNTTLTKLFDLALGDINVALGGNAGSRDWRDTLVPLAGVAALVAGAVLMLRKK